MDDKLLFRIILSTDKKERKKFSEAMFWSGFSYRTGKEKDKLRTGIKGVLILSPIALVLIFILILMQGIRLWDIILISIILRYLFPALIVPYGDYYLIEFKSKVGRKKSLINEPFDCINFYDDYIRYNGLDKTRYKEFNFKEANNSFFLKFVLNENRKAKLEGFFLVKHQDIEESGVDIDAFRDFLVEKDIAFNKV